MQCLTTDNRSRVLSWLTQNKIILLKKITTMSVHIG